MNRKDQQMGQEPIKKLLLRLSLPAFTGMMVMATYNLVDTIFVGQGVGPMGIAGLTIAFPIQMLISSFAMAIGVGGASVVSRGLGEQNPEKAANAAGNVIGIAFSIGFVVAILGYFFLEPILLLFGATENILPFARDYVGIVILSSPFISIAMSGNNIMRAEGKAKIAMWTMIISSGVNLTFDPIFIFALDMGIRGAALATVMAHISAATFILGYFGLKKSSLQIKIRHLRPNKVLLKEISAIGASSFSRQASGSIVATILNHTLGTFGGDMAIAAYGLIGRTMMFSFMPMIGVAQGYQPIAGFNYGAKKYDRVLSATYLALKAMLVAGTVGFLALMIFPNIIYSVFTTDEKLISLTVDATRKIILLLPFIGFQVIGAVVFQALGKALPALILALSRQILFFIPILLVLPNFLGLNGVWYSFPIADTLSLIVALAMIYREWQSLRAKAKLHTV